MILSSLLLVALALGPEVRDLPLLTDDGGHHFSADYTALANRIVRFARSLD